MNHTTVADLKAIVSSLKGEATQVVEEKLPVRENGLTEELRSAINDVEKFRVYLKGASAASV